MHRGDDTDEVTGDLPSPRPGPLELVIVVGHEVATHPLPQSGAIAIGRRGELRISHRSVSRRHARLDVAALAITDLGSRNGTVIRGERAIPGTPVAVAIGEPIRMGDAVAIVQRVGAAAPRAAAPIVQELPLELRLVEETARSARHGAPFVHARVHVAASGADLARDAMADALRGSDLIAEDLPGQFQLLLPATDGVHGRVVIDRLVATLAQHGVAARVGVVAYPFDGINAAQLSARARALVEATAGARTAMDEVRRMVATVASGDLSVLITGETGVGKELFAEMVHRLSARAHRPFLRLNCASISETLLESELFGHARGAFTGADSARVGLIEAADGGTLFLDEIGEMALRLQATLLRAIEEKAVRRVGESELRPVDVRIVGATNRSLRDEVLAQRFRQDLYYRISGVTLALPPLRERVDEIAGIARAFAALATARTRRAVPEITEEALRTIRAHAWPGNVRELRNTIERAVLLAGDGAIRAGDLGLGLATGTLGPSEPVRVPASADGALSSEIAELERRRIVDMLEQCGGNQTRAARALGLSRNTLLARLSTYGLRRPRKPSGSPGP
ncbi:MAG: sigma 54-interacting transcriptional regulator [Deltaproteobacteria bacterium]|nr:sigma 54-interacting transcriptional regulator [Deltaproteobacteria bacterium]